MFYSWHSPWWVSGSFTVILLITVCWQLVIWFIYFIYIYSNYLYIVIIYIYSNYIYSCVETQKLKLENTSQFSARELWSKPFRIWGLRETVRVQGICTMWCQEFIWNEITSLVDHVPGEADGFSHRCELIMAKLRYQGWLMIHVSESNQPGEASLHQMRLSKGVWNE